MIEIAADSDRFGVGRPNGEMNAFDSFDRLNVRAKFLIALEMSTFAD